ncbi:hypothetical protein PRZ48_012746 [Zasmidium cellare]|uniref:Cadmium resistance transporter n=1 Tax=Zasmidium cellare TaxID=395010 RepID=A0ABR0E667_ZASCE|nr:hypothetical protein PRZ48_012746 [Zasmidium cellare]
MQFGSTIGKACLTFVITNIDDAFVLVTFFAESSTSRNLTPWKITIGQYVGFTVIVTISMIGYAVAVALPSEPIGFLGLLPILLGVWKFLELVIPEKDDIQDAEAETNRIASAKSIFKVAGITIMNGGDNIGTYIPLFSQAQGAEIAVYVVVYYILLGVWCLLAFLVMKQKHILRVCEKYAAYVIPFLYIGLGIYITVKSDCFPWSIDEINDQFLGNPGQTVMGVVTGVIMAFIIGVFVWIRLRKRRRTSGEGEIALSESNPTAAADEGIDNEVTSTDGKQGGRSSIGPVAGKEVAREDAISIHVASKLERDNDHQPPRNAE